MISTAFPISHDRNMNTNTKTLLPSAHHITHGRNMNTNMKTLLPSAHHITHGRNMNTNMKILLPSAHHKTRTLQPSLPPPPPPPSCGSHSHHGDDMTTSHLYNGWHGNKESHNITWWPHYMAILSSLLALCVGNPPVTGGFPTQRSQKCRAP